MADEPIDEIDRNEKLNTVREMPITAEDIHFRPEELTACPACSRHNPPNRVSCLYCGTQIRTDLARIDFEQPESWEDGFSVIYAGKGNVSGEKAKKTAEFLRIETEALGRLIAVEAPVPLAYLKSLADAEHLASLLTEIGLDCAILGDDLLTPQVPPTRIRSIEFFDEGIILEDFNTANKIAVGLDERMLFVTGSIFRIRSETAGKRSKKTIKITDASESSSDESVLDIYPPSDVLGFRIRSSGFDFSCLGDEMRRIASENMVALADKLKEVFQNRIFINEYRAAYPLLDSIWPVDHGNKSSEVKGGFFGGVRIERTSISDNTAQFTRFSRLQRHFL